MVNITKVTDQGILEMVQGNIKGIPTKQLFSTIIWKTVFPFMIKPIFQTLFEVSKNVFDQLIKQRKKVILDIPIRGNLWIFFAYCTMNLTAIWGIGLFTSY